VVYSEELAGRLRERLGSVNRVTEREMFGGVSFMIAGNMCCGVLGDDLVVRIDPTLHHDALTRPNVSEFVMGGRSSRGMIRVGPGGVADEDELALWVRLGIAHATSLPPKKAGAKKRAPAKKKAPAATKKRPKAPAAKKAKKAKQAAQATKKVSAAKKGKAPVKKQKASVKRQKAPVKKKKAAVKKKKAAVKKKAAKAARRRR
jgi:TfoX/Sxy family transcriptional regulator of competence genes